MSSRHNVVDILEEGDEAEERNNFKIINICPKDDDVERDLDSSDDLSVMQQYYSASPPSSRSLPAIRGPNKMSKDSSKGHRTSYNDMERLRKDPSPLNDNSIRSMNGPMPYMTSIQSLAARVDNAMSSTSKQLPPESVFNIAHSKSGPIPMEISHQGLPVSSRIKPSEGLHRTDKNDNLIPPDSRRMPCVSRNDSQSRLLGLPMGLGHSLHHPSRHFFDRPDLPPPYGRPFYPSYGYPYYGAPYFPPPAPHAPHTTPVSHAQSAPHAQPAPHLQPAPHTPHAPPAPHTPHAPPAQHLPPAPHTSSSIPQGAPPPPSRMPGLVCRVTPPPDISPNTPVFGMIQREQDEAGKVKTFFLCDFCQLKSEDQEAFLNHVLTHMFVCSQCGQQTFSRIQLISHIAKRHPDYFAKLGRFETMQVARLGLRPTGKLVETETGNKEESQTGEMQTSDKESPSEETPSAETSPKGPEVRGVTVQDDGFTSCNVCKVTTDNSDMVLWSAHVYLHQVEMSLRIHCTLCGKFTSSSEDMLEHFFAMHGDKRVGVVFAVQAVGAGKLVYVWFCPHCSHSSESVASLTEHLQEQHALADPLTYPCIKTALEIDIKESLLERTAGVQTSLDLRVPSLLNWTATDGSAKPNPESFILSTPLMMQRSLEDEMPAKTVEPNPNNLAALKSMYDSMIVRTRMVTDLIIAARDYYSKSNGVYSCNRCLYRTRHKHLVAEHLWHHLPGAKWACNYCLFTNKRRRNVVDHLRNKHKTLSPKLIVQVPTVIDFDDKPMNVQQMNVARKSTMTALNRPALNRPIQHNQINHGSSIHQGGDRLKNSSFTASAPNSDDSCNNPTDGITLRSVLEASSTRCPVQSLPKKQKQPTSPKNVHANNVTPVLASSSSHTNLFEMGGMGKFPMNDDSSSCWVCNVCHRKDERWAVMRNHLMFAHPDLYSNECLALSRVKKPVLGLNSLTLEAMGKRRLLRPALLSVEKIYMYPHLLANSDAAKVRKEGDLQELENVEAVNSDHEDGAITLNTTGDSAEVLLLEISDESGDEQKVKNNQASNSLPRKRAFARKSTASGSRVHWNANKKQSANKLPVKRATPGVNSSIENGAALYGCFYCTREFPDSLSARSHLISNHGSKQPLVINLQQIHNPNVSRIFLCTSFKCSYSTFNENKFKMHVIHHGSGDHLEEGSLLIE